MLHGSQDYGNPRKGDLTQWSWLDKPFSHLTAVHHEFSNRKHESFLPKLSMTFTTSDIIHPYSVQSFSDFLVGPLKRCRFTLRSICIRFHSEGTKPHNINERISQTLLHFPPYFNAFLFHEKYIWV